MIGEETDQIRLGCLVLLDRYLVCIFIFAQILIYCGSIFGIDSYITRKIRKNRHKDS